MKLKLSMLVLAAMAATSSAQAAGFVNGSFETGDASGWTQGGGYRGNIYNNALDPATFLPGDGGTRNSIIAAGTVDPRIGAALGSTVYGGNYSMRVENTVNGGYASVLTQTVQNYTDANIFFAWKAVLDGAHGVNDAAAMVITLTDLTDNVVLISRTYSAVSGSVDARFSLNSLNGDYYTPNWQIEQLPINAGLSGHDFQLSVLAADCQPTGHYGYVYLDGFGAVTPPTGNVPEPATLALAGLALAGAAAARRRRAPKA